MESRRVDAFVRFAWITLGITTVVIIWGAVVRATGSGAGCGNHWPLCDGVVVPLAPGTSTIIEYTHRLTSGVAMILSLVMLVWSRRVFSAGHRARVWAAAAFVFMIIEALVGAGLVLLGLVEDNASAMRAGYIAVHLVNTMLLIGAMTGTIYHGSRVLGSSGARVPGFSGAQVGSQVRRSTGLAVTLVGLLAVAATGAVVALGDTLFPHASLAEGIAADLDPTAHFLIRLRIFHPLLAAAVALVALALTRRDPTFVSPGREGLRSLVMMLVLAQMGFGVINLAMLAPLPLQMAHLLGSNLLWTAMVWSWLSGTTQAPK